MAEIALPCGRVVLIDDDDLPLVAQYKWKSMCPSNSKTFYARSWIGGTNVLMHRLILGMTDRKTQVDHKDRNGLNNQRSNLRLCTHAQNLANRAVRKDSKSGIRGVRWVPRLDRWAARIIINGQSIHLGLFPTKEDAAAAYDAALKSKHGEFALTNNLSSGATPPNKALHRNNTTGYTNIYWREKVKKYFVQMRFNGKVMRLGYYRELEDAIAVRNRAILEKEAMVRRHMPLESESLKPSAPE